MIEMYLMWITRHRLQMIGVWGCGCGHKHIRLGAARNPVEEIRITHYGDSPWLPVGGACRTRRHR